MKSSTKEITQTLAVNGFYFGPSCYEAYIGYISDNEIKEIDNYTSDNDKVLPIVEISLFKFTQIFGKYNDLKCDFTKKGEMFWNDLCGSSIGDCNVWLTTDDYEFVYALHSWKNVLYMIGRMKNDVFMTTKIMRILKSI